MKQFLGLETGSESEKEGPIKAVVYCRVSSHDQKTKGDLDRQVGRVSAFCSGKGYHIVETLTDVGSGMSDTRPRLQKLFGLVNEGKISKVVVEHKDRLCRFGFGVMEAYFASHGVEIIWIDEILGKSYEEELVEDILTLMASFSARIYGKRSSENRKKKVQKK
jgi:predicted site-specific integrase-resolvase